MKATTSNQSKKPLLRICNNLILSIFILTTSTLAQSLNSQIHFQSNEPFFSFDLPNNWRPSNRPTSYPMIGKYVKIDENSVILGNCQISKQSLGKSSIPDMWELNLENEKKEIEAIGVSNTVKMNKLLLNGKKIIRMDFDFISNQKYFRASIYFFLLNCEKEKYLIRLYFGSDLDHIKNIIIDADQLFQNLKTCNDTQAISEQKKFNFNGVNYVVPKPIEYDYFENSIFKSMTISDFTRTYCFSDDISLKDFDMLIPKNLIDNPTIHFYTANALIDQSVTLKQFTEHKQFWKNIYDSSNYYKMLSYVLRDSLLYCEYNKNMFANPISYIHTNDEPHLLTTLLKLSQNDTTFLVITNYIHINETVFFIKLSKKYNKYTDIQNIERMSNLIVSEFIKKNDKLKQ